MTLVSITAYHSFGGEVEASNTPTIRRLTPSCCHQLPRIARQSTGPGQHDRPGICRLQAHTRNRMVSPEGELSFDYDAANVPDSAVAAVVSEIITHGKPPPLTNEER